MSLKLVILKYVIKFTITHFFVYAPGEYVNNQKMQMNTQNPAIEGLEDSNLTSHTETEVLKNSNLALAKKVDDDRDINYYRSKMNLDPSLFKRNPKRLGYAALYFGLNALLVVAAVKHVESWYLKILIGFGIGQANAGLAFVAHELLHGSIIKGKKMQDFLAIFMWTSFLMSPTFWRFWHNKLHHSHTQNSLKDPDAFPTVFIFRRSKYMQRIFNLTPGSKGLFSYLYFFYWFSFQSFFNHIYMRFRNSMWAQLDQKRVTAEFAIQFFLFAGYFYFIGFENLFYLFVIPFAVQNYTIMSYISTNHNLSPLTKKNDPLRNSLTVITNPIQDFFHLNFGYHVEHHVFPTVSGAHAKKIHESLKSHFPEDFKYMKKTTALGLLYNTPRLYKDATTLIHPETKVTYNTI